MSSNPIIWWELASHDAEKSVRFFREVFEWDLDYDENVKFYKMKHTPPAMQGGGIFTLRRAKLPFVALYIRVEDIHVMAGKITDHGGSMVDPPAEIAPGEWLCLFNEPSGVTFAMIQEATPA